MVRGRGGHEGWEREESNYRLEKRERGLPGKMFLLDKALIIFVATAQDRQGERDTIRSERVTARGGILVRAHSFGGGGEGG